MACPRVDTLVQKLCDLHDKISDLHDLSPSPAVNALFTALVTACIPPHPLDVTKLCPKIKRIRNNLIQLCGQAESLLEKHYSTILGAFENPLDHLELFPYYSNYLKLAQLEFDLLQHHSPNPTRVAFIGSGPLPLTSIVMASNHLISSVFDNYDIDASANSMASKLVKSNPDLFERMRFHSIDIMNVPGEMLKQYDVIFLAALVGMEIEDKMRVIEHLGKNMAPGAILMLRSAHGARTFLYPVVEPRDLRGFNVLSVYHPTDDVINSVVVARKCPNVLDFVDKGVGPIMVCGKCGEINQGFNGFCKMNMIEEFAGEDHVC
ncbi:Nicotianamine synthase [Handroanthus impetiginosus]|uniref:Nicotianamine synthase n=1 Tax=Handroanthus impetiginosus TaxID=429701 RepID=A0A2G9GWS4_9LAMI|nr:Nicotianamine synthase [Handroanthus impetiginosus]